MIGYAARAIANVNAMFASVRLSTLAGLRSGRAAPAGSLRTLTRPFPLALPEENQVNQNGEHHQRRDDLQQLFRIKRLCRFGRYEGGRTMTAMISESGKCVAAGRAGFEGHPH